MMEIIYHSVMLFWPPTLEAEHDVIELINASQDRLRWSLHEPRRWNGSLRRVTQARSIQGSNSIEGYHASLDDVVALVEGEEPLDATTETREAISGYRDAMTYVLELGRQPEQPVIDATLLKALHFMMLRFDLSKRPGGYRPGAIWVRRESDGTTVYEAPHIEQAAPLVDELIAALAETSGAVLVDAAMAHLNLVLIHPFSDGNGRMGRCLQTLVLARDKLLSPELNSIEEYLGRNTVAYYDVLTEVAAGSWQPSRDTRPWVRFCLTAHHRQLQTLERRVQEAERLWEGLLGLATAAGVAPRSVGALYDSALGLRLRNPSYRSSVEAAEGIVLTEQTAGRDLRLLTASGLLEARGERRGRTYVAGDPVRRLFTEVRADRPAELDDPFDLVADKRQGRLFVPSPPGRAGS
jgi:Fic family protein